MNQEARQFRLTRHALSRMSERFPEKMRDIDFQPLGNRLIHAYHFLWESTVEKQIFNDLRFMMYVHEKYGFDKQYRFFVNENMIFVGVIDNEKEVNNIVTVVDRRAHKSDHLKKEEIVVYKRPKRNTHDLNSKLRVVKQFKKAKRESVEAELSSWE